MGSPWTKVFLLAGLLGMFPGCRTADFNAPEYDRMNASDGGAVIVTTLKRQGYPKWARSGALTCKVRTRSGPAQASITTEEILKCDLVNHRLLARGNEGDQQIRRVYAGAAYREVRDQVVEQDPAILVEGRRRLVLDYFFTALPFFAARVPCETVLLEEETIGRIPYHVVEIRFDPDGYLPPDPWYRLYIRSTTQRLEKVFFQAGGGARKGQYIWCEFDNYAGIDKAFMPLHRRFYFAQDEAGAKNGAPFMEQWIFDVTLESQADDALFSMD